MTLLSPEERAAIRAKVDALDPSHIGVLPLTREVRALLDHAMDAAAETRRLLEELHEARGLWYGACAARTQLVVEKLELQKALLAALKATPTPPPPRSECPVCGGWLTNGVCDDFNCTQPTP